MCVWGGGAKEEQNTKAERERKGERGGVYAGEKRV